MNDRRAQTPASRRTEPTAGDIPDADSRDLVQELDAECQEAIKKIRGLEGDSCRYADQIRIERALRLEAEERLSLFTASRAGRLIARLQANRCYGKMRNLLLRLSRRCERVERRVRKLAIDLIPGRYRPQLLVRAPKHRTYRRVEMRLPLKDSPTRSHPLSRDDRPLSVAIETSFDSLEEVVLFLDSRRATRAHQVTVTITKDGTVARGATVELGSGMFGVPTVFRFEPLSGVQGKRLVLSVSSSSSTPADFVAVRQFKVCALKRDPWVVSDDLDLAADPACNAGEFSPCFRAEVDSQDGITEVEWLPADSARQYVPLYGDRDVALRFQCPARPLTALKVIWGTSRRVNRVRIQMSLSTEDTTWAGEFDGATLPDNHLHPLPIPAEIFSAIAGQVVTIRFSAPGAGADNQVALMGARLFASNGEGFVAATYHDIPYQVRSKSLSEIRGTPLMRAALTAYLKDEGPLRVNVVLPDASAPWWIRRFARRVVQQARDEGHTGNLFLSAEELIGRERPEHSDVLVVFEQPYTESLRRLVTEVRASYGIVVGCRDSYEGGRDGKVLALAAKDESELLAACSANLVLLKDNGTSELVAWSGRDVSLDPLHGSFEEWLNKEVERHIKTHLPRVSIVTVLYRKEREIPYFLKALEEQNYPGEIELIVVDDCSPDNSKETLRRLHAEGVARGARLPKLVVIENESNRGNCGSRNRALEVVTGEVVVIVDCDCLLNREFISAHVYSHLFHSADVVIGPCNLESGENDPLAALAEFDADRPRIAREAELQDPINLDSFVNCITRNFSIKKRHLTEPLFDELFGYSASPESGFGWEDVEMGYRLYRRGLRIFFTHQAFSVHVSHPSTTEDRVKPLKSLKNFKRLIDKHPSIIHDARRWYMDTFHKIEAWSASCGHEVVPDQQSIRDSAGAMYPYPFAIRRERRLRVLTYRWHVPHQYELYKLPYDFTLVSDLPTGFTRAWEVEQRPQPANAKFLPLEKINPEDYDLAILHFDENVLAPENCNGVIPADWGANFVWMLRSLPNLPKVAICHGTPQFIGQYRPEYHAPDLGAVIEESRRQLVEALGDLPVVCNSHQALEEWRFRNSRVIWHGFDPTEFQRTDYTGGVLSLGKAIRERPHYRGYENFKAVSALLPESERPEHHVVRKPALFTPEHEAYAKLKYQAYRDSIRRYSVYFNPTIRSPMPRSRGEAMMTGLVTVSAANHDVQLFIRNGENGFYSDSPQELADFIAFLMRNEKARTEIGGRSRATAADVFNHDRYLAAWQGLMGEVVGS